MSPKLPAGQFWGNPIQVHDGAGFCLAETRYAPGARLPRHAHELAKYCFVLTGSSTETVGAISAERQPLTLIFHPAAITHEEFHHAAGHHFHLELEAGWLERAREYSAVLDQSVDLSGSAAIGLVTRLFDEFKHLDGLSALAMEGLMLELMAETSRSVLGVLDRRPPRWLSQVEELLRTRFAETLALNELAAAVGVHAVHLARVFRRFHGCSVGEYVRRLRIEFASRQLAASDLSLADIAAAAGFADQSHFSRTFKQHTRLLPTEFRKLFRAR